DNSGIGSGEFIDLFTHLLKIIIVPRIITCGIIWRHGSKPFVPQRNTRLSRFSHILGCRLAYTEERMNGSHQSVSSTEAPASSSLPVNADVPESSKTVSGRTKLRSFSNTSGPSPASVRSV